MSSPRLRTVIASEHPEVRHLLTKVVEREPGVVVVGQADNAIKALSLARSLRPDVAVVDSQLPHAMGLDAVRLSRISGLDTAMDISQELPRARVVLLASFNVTIYSDTGLDSNEEAYLCSQTTVARFPVRLQDLYSEAAPTNRLTFANVEAKARTSARSKLALISEKTMLYSGLAVLAGLALMLTFILAASGVVLALAGIAGLLVGAAMRAAAAWWPKPRLTEREDKGTEKLEAA